MISQFAGVGGAFLAAWLAHRTRHGIGLTIGIIGGAIVLYPLAGAFGALAYAIIVSIYISAWNFVQPVMLAAMARFDRKGSSLRTPSRRRCAWCSDRALQPR